MEKLAAVYEVLNDEVEITIQMSDSVRALQMHSRARMISVWLRAI